MQAQELMASLQELMAGLQQLMAGQLEDSCMSSIVLYSSYDKTFHISSPGNQFIRQRIRISGKIFNNFAFIAQMYLRVYTISTTV